MAKRTPSTPPASRSLSPKAARQRRLQAARLFAQGHSQAEIARRLGVSRQAHGFDTDLWTLPRIAEVIWRLTGVSYHPGHVWWLLRRHDWSPQRPSRRAAERDETEIARWRAEAWPRIKGGRPSTAPGSASSTSPAVR